MGIYDAAGRDKINPDPVLTQISIEFAGTIDYIANRLFPRVNVGQQAGRYEIFGRRHFSVGYSGDVRAPGTRANEIEGEREYAEDQYFAIEHALEMPIPDEERENNPDKNIDADATEEVSSQLLLGKELTARDLTYDTTRYKTDHVVTLGSGEQFDEYDTSDPIEVFREVFRTFHESTGLVPNLGIVPWKVMSFLEDHPAIVERYAAFGGVISPEQIAQVLGIREIIVPGGQFNATTNPGQAAVLGEVWGSDTITLVYTTGRPALRTPNFGYEFNWGISGTRKVADQISMDTRREDSIVSDVVRGRRRYDLKQVGRDPDLAGQPVVAGALILDVLASEG